MANSKVVEPTGESGQGAQHLDGDEQRLHEFIDASSEWFWETDADQRFVWFSERAQDRIGASVQGLLGRTRLEIAADRIDEAKWREHMGDLDARRPFREFRYQIGAGAAWLSISGVPSYAADGTFRGYRGSGRNVTREVEAAHRARDAELRLRVAFEASYSGIAVTRLADGCFIEVNPAMARMLGLPREEIIGRTSVDLGLWTSADARQEAIRPLLLQGEVRNDLHTFRRADGTRLASRLTAMLFSMRGEPHILVTIDDLTDARRTAFEMRRLSQAMDQVSAAMFVTDESGRIEYVNKGFVRLTGYTAEEALGQTPRLLKSGQMTSDDYAALWSTLRAGGTYSGEVCNRRKDGSHYWAGLLISPIRDDDGQGGYYIAIQTDVTEQRRILLELQASEQRFRSLVESSLLGICIERDDAPLFVNQSFADIFGYADPEAIIRQGSCRLLWPAAERARLLELATTGGDAEAATSHEFRGVRQGGSELHLLAQVRRIPWHGAGAVQVSVVDITSRKSVEARLQLQANYDSLTGLPNRTLALDRLALAIRGARRRRATVGLLFIDFDRFKQINDRFGHAAGDEFLVTAARRIADVTRDEDTVGRLGGDEFVVVLPSLRTAGEAELVAQRIVERMAAPFVLGGQEVYSGASIGIAACPEHGQDAETLLRHADAAMYAAKATRGGFRVYNQALSARSETRGRLESELRRALERGQLSLVYQPLVAVASRKVVGAEALLRWTHPELGEVSPNTFIRIAEETGLIVPIGEWVIQQGCTDARAWADAGHGGVALSVNVASRQFRGGGLLDSVRRALAVGRIDPPTLELEITESLLIENVEEAATMLRALEEIGVRLAVDDFGTGYSSLTYLTRFPLDTIKIDRSFVATMIDDPKQATLVDALIAMAQRLRLRVVAEGVENATQFELLAARGCDLVQGFLISRPLPLADFITLLDGWQPTALATTAPETVQQLRAARRVCQEVCSQCVPEVASACAQIAAAGCAISRRAALPSA